MSPAGDQTRQRRQGNAEQPQVIAHRRVRERHGRGRPRLALNLTAMIDVVFLLLVYFMVATEFKLGEEIYRLDLPERRAANQVRDPFQLDELPLRVAVTTIGRVGPRSYRLNIEGPYPQPGSFEELRYFLEQRRIAPGRVGGLFEPDHPIVIEPGAATRWEHAVEAFSVAVRAGYENITLGKPR